MDTKDILVRNVPIDTYESIREAAFVNHRSVVAEVRSRLEESFGKPKVSQPTPSVVVPVVNEVMVFDPLCDDVDFHAVGQTCLGCGGSKW